jgi:YXWGXW repeat-containing protein
MRKTILTAIAGCLMAISAMGAEIIVKVAPPRAVIEERGAAPHAGYVYQRGYHRWDGNAHVWTPGVWVAPPRPHARWVDHRWEHRGNNYVFVEGHWR